MTRRQLWYMFGKPSKVHIKWVLGKLASFFVGGLILTIILTIAYSLATYVAEVSNKYADSLTWDIIKESFNELDAARNIIDNLSVSMCIWVLLEVTVNTKSDIQKKFRRLIIVYIIICIIWFVIEKLIQDGHALIIVDFILVSTLITLSWIHDFLNDSDNEKNKLGTGRDDRSVSNMMEREE